MVTDRQGNPVSGATPAAASTSIRRWASSTSIGATRWPPLDRAIAEAPGVRHGPPLQGVPLALATEPAATRGDREIVEARRGLPSTIASVATRRPRPAPAGNWVGGGGGHGLPQRPRIRATSSRSRPATWWTSTAPRARPAGPDRPRACPQWSRRLPARIVLGMYAFGLEETGDYARAEEAGRRAIDLEPLDCWAHHAVAHVMEMQGRAQDGIGWMIAREPHWAGDDNFFKVHNWWHRALCHLDLGQVDEVARALRRSDPGGPQHGGARPRRRVGVALAPASVRSRRRRPLDGAVPRCWDQHADGAAIRSTTGTPSWPTRRRAGRRRRRGSPQRLREAADGRRRGRALGAAKSGCRWSRGSSRSGAATTARVETSARRAATSQQVRRQPRPARHHRLDADRGGRARRLADLAEALAHERLAFKPHSPVNRPFLERARARL